MIEIEGKKGALKINTKRKRERERLENKYIKSSLKFDQEPHKKGPRSTQNFRPHAILLNIDLHQNLFQSQVGVIIQNERILLTIIITLFTICYHEKNLGILTPLLSHPCAHKIVYCKCKV